MQVIRGEEGIVSFQDFAESRASRLHLGAVSPRLLVGAVVIVVAILACVAFGLLGPSADAGGFAIERGSESSSASTSSSSADVLEVPSTEICVHVGGCVSAPGVYCLAEGDRVADAIAQAGGMTAEAAPDALNLARVLTDGEQVIVASAADVAEAAAGATPDSPSSPASAAAARGGMVNINTASSQELQTISGIGEAKAKRIIDYREKNGPFKTVDELTNVSGIGEKTLEGLRDQICV